MLDSNIFKDTEYMRIIDSYLNNEKVQCLKNIPHHDSNRLNHCLKVSYLSYKICKKHNFNYESAAKAGLLHDLYYNRINDCSNATDKIKLFTNGHPKDAVKNAEELFSMTPLEKEIILTHMWPLSKYVPKHKESMIVSLSDKYYSFQEFGTKLNYNFSYLFGVYFLLAVHFIFK